MPIGAAEQIKQLLRRVQNRLRSNAFGQQLLERLGVAFQRCPEAKRTAARQQRAANVAVGGIVLPTLNDVAKAGNDVSETRHFIEGQNISLRHRQGLHGIADQVRYFERRADRGGSGQKHPRLAQQAHHRAFEAGEIQRRDRFKNQRIVDAKPLLFAVLAVEHAALGGLFVGVNPLGHLPPIINDALGIDQGLPGGAVLETGGQQVIPVHHRVFKQVIQPVFAAFESLERFLPHQPVACVESAGVLRVFGQPIERNIEIALPRLAFFGVNQSGLFGNVHDGFLQRRKLAQCFPVHSGAGSPIGHRALVESLERRNIGIGEQSLAVFFFEAIRTPTGHPFQEVIGFDAQWL